MYKPTNCSTLAEPQPPPQIRLGIQGFPGTGKTWAALTFPGCVVANLDKGLGAHAGRADVIEIPMWDNNWCRKFMNEPGFHPNSMKDLVIRWLETEAVKLEADQTLVFDGGSELQNIYHRWFKANKNFFLTQGGQINDFKEWTEKKTFFGEVCTGFKALRCNVVYLCHEVDLKDKNGVQGPTYSGKIRPLLTGAFGDEIGGHFTDWFRAHCAAKPDFAAMKDEDVAKMTAVWGMTKQEFKAYCDTIPGKTIYYWQTQGDNLFDAKASSLVPPFPLYVPADFKSFAKYKRKNLPC